MKTLVLSMLAMASIAAMTSCSNENDPIDEVNPQGGNDKVEIKLKAAVADIITKAPIEGSSSPTFDAFVVRMDGQNQSEALDKINQAQAITANVTSGSISFAPAQYFLNTGNTYFMVIQKEERILHLYLKGKLHIPLQEMKISCMQQFLMQEQKIRLYQLL